MFVTSQKVINIVFQIHSVRLTFLFSPEPAGGSGDAVGTEPTLSTQGCIEDDDFYHTSSDYFLPPTSSSSSDRQGAATTEMSFVLFGQRCLVLQRQTNQHLPRHWCVVQRAGPYNRLHLVQSVKWIVDQIRDF